jgi:hypothetical protein
VRTRMPGGVAGVPPTMEAPYADALAVFSAIEPPIVSGYARHLPMFQPAQRR